MNNKSFINNMISEFPIFILGSKDCNLIINYIKQVALKIADAKDEQFKELIRKKAEFCIIVDWHDVSFDAEKFIKEYLNL